MPALVRAIAIIVLSLAADKLSAEESWLIGEFEDFKIYSNASERRTVSIIKDLSDVRSALSSVFPLYKKDEGKKLRVYVCRNQATITKFSRLFDGKPKRIKGLFHRDFEGSYIVIDASGDFESIRRTVYHEYTHFLLHNREFQIPAWLNEGLAETFSTIEFTRSKIRLGKVDPYNARILKQEQLIPFSRFFLISAKSPEYNSESHGRTIFYAQSWALTHYLLFGEFGVSQKQREEILDVAITRPWLTESDFKRILDLDLNTLESRLRTYVSRGKYNTISLPRDESAKRLEIEFRQARPPEIDLVYGSLILNRREPEDAFPFLYRAHKGLPDSAEAEAWRGYLDIKRGEWDLAKKWLERAVNLEPNTPAPYLHYAQASLKVANPFDRMNFGAFDRDATANLTRALLKARELGESRPQLYQFFGNIWACSTVQAGEQEIRVLKEGMEMYPDDLYLGYILAHLYFENGQIDEASDIVKRSLSRRMPPGLRDNFDSLNQRLAEKGVTISP